MQKITGFILAVYNFFVGDPVILSGVALFFLGVGFIAHTGVSATTQTLLGIILIVGIILSTSLALAREVRPHKK